MESTRRKQPTLMDIYQVRARLTRALARVERAIDRTNEHPDHQEPSILGLERLRDDLLIVLWLIEIALSEN